MALHGSSGGGGGGGQCLFVPYVPVQNPESAYDLLFDSFGFGADQDNWVLYGEYWEKIVTEILSNVPCLHVYRAGSLSYSGGLHVRSVLPIYPVYTKFSEVQNVMGRHLYTGLVLEFMLFVDYYLKANAFFGFGKHDITWPQGNSQNVVGFRSENDGSGFPSFYALTKDGVGETKTFVGRLSDAPAQCYRWHKYKIVITYTDFIAANGNVKFYLDDTLKATHTTNLYSAYSYLNFYFYFANLAAGTNCGLSNVRVYGMS